MWSPSNELRQVLELTKKVFEAQEALTKLEGELEQLITRKGKPTTMVLKPSGRGPGRPPGRKLSPEKQAHPIYKRVLESGLETHKFRAKHKITHGSYYGWLNGHRPTVDTIRRIEAEFPGISQEWEEWLRNHK